MKSILLKPKNALIKQYEALFQMEGVELIMSDAVIDYIVEKALEFKLGARGLRSICEEILSDYMYDSPSEESVKKIIIEIKDAKKVIDKLRLKAA